MAIGTSLGAYFETSFDHHAGNETLDQNEYSDEGITHDDTPIPVSDIKTSSPLVTITDEDIDKGMGLALSFSGGGLTTGKVLPMRRAANDNAPVYNTREPNMIGNKDVDKEILSSWEEQVARHQRGNEIFSEQDKLMEILKTRKWNDLENHKYNKLNKEHEQLFPPGNYPD